MLSFINLRKQYLILHSIQNCRGICSRIHFWTSTRPTVSSCSCQQVHTKRVSVC